MGFSIYNVDSSNKLDGINTKYESSGTKKIAISNNVTKLNMISTLTSYQMKPSSLKRVRIGKNITSLDNNCFKGCTNLNTVQNCTNIVDIGDYAFQNCSSLKSIAIFDSSNTQKLDNIGVSAFCNTGLEKVYLSFRGSSTETQIQQGAFSNCSHLTDFTWKTSDYTTHYMFQNCTALTGVHFCNKHSFLGTHVFSGCTALKSVTIPANCYGINDYTFENCTNLTSVTVNNPSLMNLTDSLGSHIFTGTAIESFTLPTSITSFSMISENAFTGATRLSSLTFSGMTASQLWEEKQSETKNVADYTCNKWLYNNTEDPHCGYTYSEECSDFENLITTGQNLNIPMIIVYTQSVPGKCPWCDRLKPYMNSDDTINWMKSLTKNILFGYIAPYQTLATAYKKLRKSAFGESLAHYPDMILYWKKQDGTEVGDAIVVRRQNCTNILNIMKNFVEVSCADYTGSSKEEYTLIKSGITDTNCFGLNHDCTIFSSDGKQIQYTDDGSGGGSIEYERTTQVDRITTDDFRYGQWYYQAKDLREYADANQIPVFLEFSSSRMCQPCKDFHSYIFNDSRFQNYMKSKKILLCNVDSPSGFKYDVANYVTHQWANPEDPDFENKLPVMMLYWYQKNGAGSESGTQTPYTFREYGYYLGHEDPSLSDQWNFAKISSWVENFCIQYTPDSKFNPPDIDQDGMQNIPNKYKIYENQSNDNYGRYYPVYELLPTNGLTYTVKIGSTEYNINESMVGSAESPMPPNGTYQYFTTTSTDSDYELTCDEYGIIFKVGPNNVISSIFEEEVSPSSSRTLDAYRTSYGITDDKITGTNISFHTSIYQVSDETGDYLYETKTVGGTDLSVPIIDTNNTCKTETHEYQYNLTYSYEMNGFTYSSKNINKVVLDLTAVAYTDDEGQTLKYQNGGYVVNANFISYSESDGKTGLRWLSAFSNDNQEE